LLRPAAVTEGDLDTGGEEGDVAAGLGGSDGVKLVGMVVASRWVEGRGGSSGDERGSIPTIDRNTNPNM
jgi:hypothetical protein